MVSGISSSFWQYLRHSIGSDTFSTQCNFHLSKTSGTNYWSHGLAQLRAFSPYNHPMIVSRTVKATNRAHVFALRGGAVHLTHCVAPLSAASPTPPRGEVFPLNEPIVGHILRNQPLEQGPCHSPCRATRLMPGSGIESTLAAGIGRQGDEFLALASAGGRARTPYIRANTYAQRPILHYRDRRPHRQLSFLSLPKTAQTRFLKQPYISGTFGRCGRAWPVTWCRNQDTNG